MGTFRERRIFGVSTGQGGMRRRKGNNSRPRASRYITLKSSGTRGSTGVGGVGGGWIW